MDLSQRIATFTTGAYSTPELKREAEEYQKIFSDEGARKSKWILQQLFEMCDRHAVELNKIGYISIGGADGSEVESVLLNSPISESVLLEYDTGACQQARMRVASLKGMGKSLHVVQGDAVDRLDEGFQYLKRRGCEAVCVSAQAILHELPRRSNSFAGLDQFLSNIFSHFETTIFISREPCKPVGLPDRVELKIPGVSAALLQEFIRLVSDQLKFHSSDTSTHPNDYVQLEGILCVEVLHKLLRSQTLQEFKYEMGEVLTSLDTRTLHGYLSHICINGEVDIEYLTTDGFKREYLKFDVDLREVDSQKMPLLIPRTHARISAIKVAPPRTGDLQVVSQGKKSGAYNHAKFALDANPLSRRLNQLTTQMSKRSDLVQNAKPEDDAFKPIKLSTGLYVKRSIEDRIESDAILTPRRFSLITVKGEPGYGKSSLLWSLEKSFNANSKNVAWLIDANDLLNLFGEYENETFRQFSQFRSLIELVHPEKNVILLIDTVDAVLNREKESDLFCRLLADLRALPIVTILATRPIEAVLLEFLEPSERILSKYDDAEFVSAAEKYAKAFLQSERDQKSHSARLTSAVAQGLPIKEVAYNPLALRMLYSIYAPLKINFDEINIISLYCAFWERKVEDDIRTFGVALSRDKEDLSRSTCALGVALLAEGRQEVPKPLAQKYLSASGENSNDIDKLVDRGVLSTAQIVSENRVAFFHQTFFEHSAAVGLLKYGGEKALEALYLRYLTYDGNDFIAAILEKALVLAQLEIHTISRVARKIICELLTSGNKNVVTGIYAFVHSSDFDQQVFEHVHELFIENNHLAIERYLMLFDNIPIKLRPKHFALLKLALNVNSNRIVEKALQKVSYLASIDSNVARAFLDDSRVSEVLEPVLTKNSNGRKYYQDIVSALCIDHPKFARVKLIHLLRVSIEKSYGDNELQWLLHAFDELLPAKMALTTKEIEDVVGDGDRKISDSNQRALAKAYYADMKKTDERCVQLFESVSKQQYHSRIFYVRLMAISEGLSDLQLSLRKGFLRKCIETKNHFSFRSLASISWLNFIEHDIASDNPNIRDDAYALIHELVDGFELHKIEQRHKFALILFQSSEGLAALTDVFFNVSDDDAFEFWTRKDLMGSVIAKAYMAGNIQARHVIESIIKNTSISPSLANTLARQFGFFLHDQEAVRVGVKLAAIGNDPDTQLKLLESLNGDFSREQKYFEPLMPTYRLCSSKGDNYSRRRKARYERQFAYLNIKLGVRHQMQRQELELTRDKVELAIRLDTYNVYLMREEYPANEKELEWLICLMRKANDDSKTNLIQCLCTIFYKNPRLASKYFSAVFDYATTSDAVAADLHPIARVLYEAHELESFSVFKYCEEFFERVQRMSNKTVQGAYNRYAKLYLLVSRRASSDWVVSLIKQMSEVTPEVARLLLPTLQTLSEEEFEAVCKKLLNSKVTPVPTKHKIMEVKRRYETRNGIEEWTEVYGLCFG